ncbi:MAG: ACT domain-containing protein [Proteobacteria bacterium]|nr:ACT domain-containing protein [Pseudomonadota bacterium]
MGLSLRRVPEVFSICKLPAGSPVPAWATAGSFWSITGTADELSIVCESVRVPAGVTSNPNWRALMVQGPLDFSLTGILSALAAPLATAGISIFAVSTFDTDSLLVKELDYERAISILISSGHGITD